MRSVTQPVVLFDGVCNLCESSVLFLIQRDRKKQLYFASLQSEYSKSLLKVFGQSNETLDSIIFVDQNQIYLKSTAALKIAMRLGGLFKLCWIFFIVPRFLRDLVYDLVAKRRYRWFGQKNQCMMPTPELRDRFLD